MNHDVAGRCGMYCGICEIYRGYRDAGRLRMEVAQKYGCQAGDVHCRGCRAVHVVGWGREEDWGRTCRILRCLKSQDLESCGDCRELSECGIWQALAAQNLSYGVDLKANLAAIHQVGLDEWLRAQETRWQCQQCGRPVAVASATPHCHHCGGFQL